MMFCWEWHCEHASNPSRAKRLLHPIHLFSEALRVRIWVLWERFVLFSSRCSTRLALRLRGEKKTVWELLGGGEEVEVVDAEGTALCSIWVLSFSSKRGEKRFLLLLRVTGGWRGFLVIPSGLDCRGDCRGKDSRLQLHSSIPGHAHAQLLDCEDIKQRKRKPWNWS